MFEIKKVINEEMAKECDILLTKLVQSERKYDKNIKENFVVTNNYVNLYNKDNNILYISCDNEKPVGFIYGYIKYEQSNFVFDSVAQIDALYVLDNYRNKGIGKKLIDKFYEWCEENNIKIVEISVFKNNTNAYNLYEKLGYEVTEYKMVKEL